MKDSQNKTPRDYFLLSGEGEWFDKAMGDYYQGRIYQLLDQVGSNPHPSLVLQWHELLEELYGNNQNLKSAVIETALTDDRVSVEAKVWLQHFI